jgi:hypothetical protein
MWRKVSTGTKRHIEILHESIRENANRIFNNSRESLEVFRALLRGLRTIGRPILVLCSITGNSARGVESSVQFYDVEIFEVLTH